MFSLKDKVCVITGASQGLGLATARRFAAAGARLAIGDIQDCSEIAKELGAVYVRVDVSKEKEVENLMKTAYDTYGPLDVVVNNAGVIMPEQMIDDAVVADYQRLFNINTIGALLGIKYGAKYMRDGGSIMSTASDSANGDFAGYGAYIASKTAIVGITKAAAIEYAARRIRVNCICPSTMNTPMANAPGCETELQVVKYITPLERMCEPEEAAALFHFLASDDCRFITGEDIYIDGGIKSGHPVRNMDLILKALEAKLE